MKEQPKKPRWKKWLLTSVAALGLGGGAFFMTGGDIADTFNKSAAPDPGNVTISTILQAPATVNNDNVIYYEDRVVPVDEATIQANKTVYSTTIVPVSPDSGKYPVIIIPVVPPNTGNGGSAP